MADNLDTIGNFSIQDTFEMGSGNTELLNDLLAPETASTDPKDVEPIIKEAELPKEEPAKTRGKEITPEGEEETSQSLISNFLGTEEEEETPAKPSPVKEALDKTEDEAPTGTQFSALSNDLFKLGVFSKDENEEDVPINTAEEFLERFQSEKKKGAVEMVENFIAQFGDDYKQAFESIFVKGVDPKEYFGTYNQIASFAEMDLSDERNQERVMKQTLTEQGFDPEDVETEIERLKNYGDLESVATKHHKVLVRKEATKLQELEQQSERELQQRAAIKQKYVSNVQNIIQEKIKTKEFDGIPINPKLATELQEFLLVDKWKTPSGETLTDFDRAILDMKRPENHEMKVKVGLLLKILEKDPTLSTIQKTGITKKSNELFSEVARQVTKPKTESKPSSWFL